MTCRRFFEMDHFPVQIIGDILSRLDSAQDIIAASATCKKWREARHNHLHFLCFNFDLLPPLPALEYELIITKNVLRTKGLQSMSILTDLDCVFSAAAVIACILHTWDTLRNFYIDVGTSPSINILELCNRKILEELFLSFNSINGVGPVYMKFPALKSLLLNTVCISLPDLSLLISMCPKLEVLSLTDLNFGNSDAHATMELRSATLKEIFVESIGLKNLKLGKFILEAASIETVHLRRCTLEHFELVGKGSLKILHFENVSVLNLDIGENLSNLEVVDVRDFPVMWPKLYHMIARSSKLRKFSLWEWDFVFGDEDEVVNLETISVCFPQLTELTLRCRLTDERLHYGMQGSWQLQNLTILEVEWTVMSKLFLNWIDILLQRCPRLKNLVIYGTILEARIYEDSRVLAEFTTSIFRVMRKYPRVDVQFEFRGKLRSHAF